MSERLLSESIWSDAKDQGICLQCFLNKWNLSYDSLSIQGKQSKGTYREGYTCDGKSFI